MITPTIIPKDGTGRHNKLQNIDCIFNIGSSSTTW